MSALADFLIDLTDPETRSEFDADPENSMNRAGLTEFEKHAVRSRNGAWIRYQIKNGGSAPLPEGRNMPEIAAGVLAIDVIDVIDVVDVVVVAETGE